MADQQHSTFKHHDHLLLDQNLLRLPYELLRQNFHAAHVTVERESSAIKAQLKEAAVNAVAGRAAPADSLRSLDAMLARLRTARDRLAALADEEARLHRQLTHRSRYLHDLLAIDSPDDPAYDLWARRRLDRLLVDYLLRHGHGPVARALAASRDIEHLVDLDVFATLDRISTALRNGSVSEALAWTQDNRKELKRLDSHFEFLLRLQQFVKIVRSDSPSRMLEAVAHAKKYLAPFRDTWSREIQQACGLLAVAPSSRLHGRIYESVCSPQRWDLLADVFTKVYHAVLALPRVPLLHLALSTGLSALKTSTCLVAPATTAPALAPTFALPASSACPVCAPELNELARHVPCAHHTKSCVDPDQLLLPNGHAYSRAPLTLYARKAGLLPDKIKDPRTGQVYDVDKLRKVFIT